MYRYGEIIIHAALIMDLERGPKGLGFDAMSYQRNSSVQNRRLDWAIDIINRLPDDKKAKIAIFDYARGVRPECSRVKAFILSVPESSWLNGEALIDKI